ncbi:MAG: FAD-binding oxidoreductase [Deltaproteobacteria bacterium]|nr:FAD-binding oxidoreductase [Deltaproteobacteria bacterium]
MARESRWLEGHRVSGNAAPSPWMDPLPEAAPALKGECRVDVAVVGAGYTGLCAALSLRAEHRSVAVLESAYAGFGASGRNAGHLTPTIGKDLPTLARLYGRERARDYVAFAEAAVEHVESKLVQYEIDCDYHPRGNVVAAVHPRQHARLEAAARLASELGAKVTFLSPDEMRRRGLPAAFSAGYLEERGGTLHPGRYVQGLRRAVLAAGISLFERTPVSRLRPGPEIVLDTAGGCVIAKAVVLGTNAFTPRLGLLRSVALPVWVSLFETEPLNSTQRTALGWPGREGIYTAHAMLESYHLTAAGTIVGGAKCVRYRFGGRPPPEQHPPTFARLEQTFRARFPELAELRIAHFWSGPIAIPLNFLPAVGRTGRYRNVYYALGYAGHGVAQASYLGAALADYMAERPGPADLFAERSRIPLPPEPLRWLTFRGLTALFGVLDSRLDRAAHRWRGTERT